MFYEETLEHLESIPKPQYLSYPAWTMDIKHGKSCLAPVPTQCFIMLYQFWVSIEHGKAYCQIGRFLIWLGRPVDPTNKSFKQPSYSSLLITGLTSRIRLPHRTSTGPTGIGPDRPTVPSGDPFAIIVLDHPIHIFLKLLSLPSLCVRSLWCGKPTHAARWI